MKIADVAAPSHSRLVPLNVTTAGVAYFVAGGVIHCCRIIIWSIIICCMPMY